MGTGYETMMRLLDSWEHGTLVLSSFESNPRSGPPDCCIAAERDGECWLAPPCEDTTDWAPCPHERSRFAVFLLSPKGEVLHSSWHDTPEEQSRQLEEARNDLKSIAGWPEPGEGSGRGCRPRAGETGPVSTNGEESERREDADWGGESDRALRALKKKRIGRASKPLFSLGRVFGTLGALAALSEVQVAVALYRHERGDWGDVEREDWLENDRALHEGSWLFSAYHTLSGVKHWVITDHDRSVTTVLLPQED